MTYKVDMRHMTWPEVKAVAESEASIIVLPVGATEQHGHHLPLGTDSIMVEKLCIEAAAQVPGVVVAPTIWYGTSPNHADFPGTVSISLDTLKSLIMDAGSALLGYGFDMMLIVNGHGGNTPATVAAAHDLRLKANKLVGELSWTVMVRESWNVLESKVIWHADEQETSLMLSFAPELVQLDKAVDELPPPVPYFEFTEEALLATKIDLGLPRTQAITQSGVIGEAKLGTAEKGDAMRKESVGNMVQTLHELRASIPELTARLTR